MKGYITILCVFGILWASTVFAQNTAQNAPPKTITGKVVDDKKQPIDNVKISVNRSKFVYTQPNGEFTINSGIAADEVPTSVRADKQGLIIKDWSYTGNQMNIIMALPRQVKGRVISNRQVPVSGIKVLLIGIRGLEAVKTDEAGYFSFAVPEDTKIDENSAFVVFDPDRLKGRANYEVRIKDGLVYLIVDIPPKPVRTVRVINKSGAPVSDVEVYIDQLQYKTNQGGTFKTQNEANDFSGYLVKGYEISKLSYEDISSTMIIAVNEVRTVSEDGSEQPRVDMATIIDNKQVSIFEERAFLQEDLANDRSLASDIEEILRTDTNISEEEKRQLELRLANIQARISEREKALAIVREKAEIAILELEQAFSDELDEANKILKETIKEKELAEENTQLAKDIAFRTNLIFAIIAIATAIILIIVFINYRKIRGQKDQIKETNNQLTEKSKQLEEKNIKIMDSIRYAETIQASILPNEKALATSLSEFFIFYQPRDIVSGDFYWFAEKGDNLLIAAADCTGHGVPGAFMTMMGNTLLNQIVNESNETDPAKILTVLNEQVQSTLNQKERITDREIDGDGMDIALLNIDPKAGKVVFAGAKSPFYYVTKEGKLIYQKGTNLSIGSTLSKKAKEFKNIEIDLEGGEVFYLVSDGFQDQLGGTEKKKKKFMKTRFMELLTKCSAYPMNDQKKKFTKEFKTWKGETPQTDDVVILGFRI